MQSPDLLIICLSAFIAVFLILVVLSVIMRVITAVWPEKIKQADSAVIAAIHTTYNAIYPGTKITKIEEEK